MNGRSGNNEHIYKSVDAAIRIGFISLLVIWCYSILKPLIVTVVWGIIIAVGIYPVHEKFSRTLKGRKKASAVLITLAGIAILVVPTVLFISFSALSCWYSLALLPSPSPFPWPCLC